MKSWLVTTVLAVFAAIVLTGVSFLVTEPVLAPVPGAPGVESGALVYGFPLPYSTAFCCMSGAGPGYAYSFGMNSSYFLNPIGLVADFCIWLAISLGCVYAFTIRRLLLSAGSGLVITLGTLLLSPLPVVAPYAGTVAVLNPMGFPYAFLTHYAGGFPGAFSSGYEFSLGQAIADYVLWAAVVLAIIGLTTWGARRRQRNAMRNELPKEVGIRTREEQPAHDSDVQPHQNR